MQREGVHFFLEYLKLCMDAKFTSWFFKTLFSTLVFGVILRIRWDSIRKGIVNCCILYGLFVLFSLSLKNIGRMAYTFPRKWFFLTSFLECLGHSLETDLSLWKSLGAKEKCGVMCTWSLGLSESSLRNMKIKIEIFLGSTIPLF